MEGRQKKGRAREGRREGGREGGNGNLEGFQFKDLPGGKD